LGILEPSGRVEEAEAEWGVPPMALRKGFEALQLGEWDQMRPLQGAPQGLEEWRKGRSAVDDGDGVADGGIGPAVFHLTGLALLPLGQA